VTSPAGTRVFDKDDISSTKRKLIEILLSSKKLIEILLSSNVLREKFLSSLEECGIGISEEELKNMKTIDELIDFILYRIPED
jgi:hypothetical protein